MPTLRIPDECVYVPLGADKGDCPFCQEGVLGRNLEMQKLYKVDEAYQCDICGRIYIEGIRLMFRFPEYLGIPRRCFVEVRPENYFYRLESVYV